VSHLALAIGAAFDATSGFVKSCITRSYIWFKPYSNIVPKIEMIAKQFIAIVGVIGLLLCNNSAYGEVNSDKAVSRHEIIELIKTQEVKHHIPSGLLLAVIKTESNLNPFALNINGKPLYFRYKDEAIKAINQAISSGVVNIDIGISQINYRWHGENFTSIDSMLSLDTNISYAAEHLSNLKLKHGDWHKALRHYHSAKPIHHKLYSRKVVACWLGI
jgi:soluble lytic murein transglycosylase-like protein